ncbi:unnamed protein product [Vicia faba]|uniref:Uncharacterized protein n=1 Tax=Vicia faba TaxID=3906 RepID=A0AAV0ZE11_VICFA|nr:unnamed protein product [Vicia faba]
MVVEAFLSSFFGVVFEMLASSNLVGYFHNVKLDTLVEELESILNSINQVLDDAEKKQYENPDVKTWLGDVKHAMYEADLLLDEIATDAPLKKMRVESQPSTSTIFDFIPTLTNPFKSRLKELIESLDSLVGQKDELELKKRVCAYNEDGVNLELSERLPTTYLVDPSRIYGRDADKDEMIKVLLSENGSDNQVPVISIVGLGGMGKTTFAKLVYNDHAIEDHFELKAWVYVPEPLDVVGLTKEILKSFHSSLDDESVFNLLQQQGLLKCCGTGKSEEELAKSVSGEFCMQIDEAKVQGLGNVIAPVDDAIATLKDKKYLEEILMKFNSRRDEMYDSIVESSVSVLEALQPNSNLKRLTIENYFGIMFPNWINGCHLPNLVSFTLHNCGLCSHLPSLGQLPYLKELFISDCTGIKIIGEEFYGNNSTSVPFRSLEVLKFERMDNWEKWFCLDSLEGFPLLKDLSIRFCCKLKRALPQYLPSLQNLEILSCKELEASIPKGDNIRVINVMGCDRILINELSPNLKNLFLSRNQYTKFPQGQSLLNNAIPEDFVLNGFVECHSLDLHCYNSLSTISIAGWPGVSFPFLLYLLTNLHSLSLSDCPRLESFPMGGLPSNLGYLEILNCPKLIASREEWGLFQLNSLIHINISGHDFENVKSFPEENLLPPTLEYLTLKHCSKLRSVNYKGLLHLKSLVYLSIYNCPSLESLPEEGLPNSLFRLFITRCPLLEVKYRKEGGERWHSISHIPSVWIDDFEQQE